MTIKREHREERHLENKIKGVTTKFNGGYSVEQACGVTTDYNNDGYRIGSHGVDKSSAAYRMCG